MLSEHSEVSPLAIYHMHQTFCSMTPVVAKYCHPNSVAAIMYEKLCGRLMSKGINQILEAEPDTVFCRVFNDFVGDQIAA